MSKYRVIVSEVRHYDVAYIVEADSPEEAVEMAEQGDSIKETQLKNHGVMDRHVHDEPELVEDDE